MPTLTLHLLDDAAEFVVSNPGPGTLRIWNRETSWGWDMLALELVATQTSARATVTPQVRRWTRNFPRWVDLAAGGSHRVLVPGGSSQWKDLEQLDTVRTEPLEVTARLRIPASPPATQHGVFVGDVSSRPVTARPPHRWLFGAG